MTTRRVYTIPHIDVREAQEAAKAQARAGGHTIRTVARITPDSDGWRVELVVADPTNEVGGQQADQGEGDTRRALPRTPRGSWVREARAEALDWRAERSSRTGGSHGSIRRTSG